MKNILVDSICNHSFFNRNGFELIVVAALIKVVTVEDKNRLIKMNVRLK